MMGCSVGQPVALDTYIFSDSMNSVAKLLVDEKKIALADSLID